MNKRISDDELKKYVKEMEYTKKLLEKYKYNFDNASYMNDFIKLTEALIAEREHNIELQNKLDEYEPQVKQLKKIKDILYKYILSMMLKNITSATRRILHELELA